MDSDTFVKAVRAGESLAGFDLRDADPFIMDLSGLDLREADLSRSVVPDAVQSDRWAVTMTDVTRRARRHVRLRGAQLAGARLDRILGSRADLRGASLSGATFIAADLRDANFSLADVRGADFTDANLEGARFHGATWDDSTVWPDGFDPV